MPKYTLELKNSKKFNLEAVKSNLNLITRPSYAQLCLKSGLNIVRRLASYINKENLGLYLSIGNNDQKTTKNEVIVLLHHVIGEPETHYRISEDPTFGNVRWMPYSNPVNYKFESPSKGFKTIYCQTKNQYVESEIADVTIELI